MARVHIDSNISYGGIFLPGQLLAFGSVVLHADSNSHLDQVDCFALDQMIGFGNLEYTADSLCDLVL